MKYLRSISVYLNNNLITATYVFMSIHETMGKVKYVPVLKNTEMLADIDVAT